MATVTIRLDDALHRRLQETAQGRGLTLSELLRVIIDDHFEPDERAQRELSLVPEGLSVVDRQQLVLLHKILARLVDPAPEDDRLAKDGDTTHQLDLAQALEEGFTTEYDTEFISIEPELTRRDCALVMDILDMFRVLKFSIAELEQPLPDDVIDRLKFHGFDHNNRFEHQLLDYARFLTADGERWAEQHHVFTAQHGHGNSHRPMLGAYQRMLEVFTPIWKGVIRHGGRDRDALTATELQQIADAAADQRNRPRP